MEPTAKDSDCGLNAAVADDVENAGGADAAQPTEPARADASSDWPTDANADPVVAERWGADASVWPY